MQSKLLKDKISIVIHPISKELLYELEPGMGKLSEPVLYKILEWTTPFSVAKIEGVKSKLTNEEINGDLIMCPLLMEQFMTLNPKRLLRKVTQAAQIAKSGGARLVCLVAYTAMVGTKGLKIQDAIGIPYTNGLSLTSFTLSQSIIKAAQMLHYNRPLKVFIYGGNSLIYLMVKGLESVAEQFYIYYHKKDRLLTYYNALPAHLRKRIKILSAPSPYLIKDADVIVNATYKFPAGFSDKMLKKGAIVLDVSYPRTIYTNRADILIIDGAAIVPPGKPKFNLNFSLPEGLCFPCMAEPMVLAFEKKYESYSFGKDIYYDKAESIYNLALKHGFSLGPLTAYEQVIPDEKIEIVAQLSKKRNYFFKVF